MKFASDTGQARCPWKSGATEQRRRWFLRNHLKRHTAARDPARFRHGLQSPKMPELQPCKTCVPSTARVAGEDMQSGVFSDPPSERIIDERRLRKRMERRFRRDARSMIAKRQRKAILYFPSSP